MCNSIESLEHYLYSFLYITQLYIKEYTPIYGASFILSILLVHSKGFAHT